ncbi:PH domain-containing protein -like isoform X1 [Vespula squamosa]|uniref:hydroxyisourate hydrolase n=1 Tax=Vespula squamosa TaxID=30214 RepID=A0ABD2A3C0_VESSQ
MEKKVSPTLIAVNEAALRTNLLGTGPRLTPTGKISYAKTRVYTQRYRKEWEQMPDFKGWLTSVAFQPTRAYCTYCKKNLHAHRLSLLKHTCTMKHQRAALSYEAEEKKNVMKEKCEPLVELEVEENNIVESLENTQVETEENDDEIEYVVERLDEIDDVELNEVQVKQQEEVVEEEYADVEEDENLPMPSDEEDIKPTLKKVKIESVEDFQENSRDALAEAMAHVHGEYLEEVDDQENIQMEMIVESEDPNVEIQDMQNLTKSVDNNKKMKEDRENNRSIRRNAKNEKRPGVKLLQDDIKSQTDSGIIMACPLPLLSTTYQINTSVAGTPGTIGVLQPVNTLPIAPAQNKTITLTSGGKTLTLTGGTFQPGTQYVLSKLKGKIPTLVMAEKKPIAVTKQPDETLKVEKKSQEQLVTASTSQSSSKKHVVLKPLKSSSKRPRVSTHVIDTSKGIPVGGLQVSLYKLMDGRWTFLNESNTGPNGRCSDLVDNTKVNFTAGRYKIHFDIDKYFTLRRIETMYPFIEIVFDVKNPAGHYHIPVLLSPFGYSTYRGFDR